MGFHFGTGTRNTGAAHDFERFLFEHITYMNITM